MLLTLLAAAAFQQPAWADDGFAESGGKLSGLRAHADRALGLEGDLSKLVPAGDPSKYDVITDMALLRGRLFASSSFRHGAPGGYSASAEILEALPTGEWKVVKDVRGSMVLNLRAVGDRLMYACFSGPTDVVGWYDGAGEGTLGRLPQRMLHGMDVCAFRGKLYWSGSLRPLTAEEFRENPAAAQGLGVVYESADDGRTWNEIYRDREAGRLQDMVVLNDRLYANRRGIDLVSWDGAAWKEVPVGVPARPGQKALLGDGLLTVFRGAILAASNPLYYRFDGEKWTSHTPGFLRLFVDGERLLGLRSDGHVYESGDGTAWKRLTESGVPPEEFGPANPHPLRRGSVAAHAGRLIVGTGSEGKIYASPVASKGTFTSRVRPVEGGARLTWEADVPKGTALAVALRTAASERGFAGAEWRAVDGPPAIPAGHRFLQYRVTFTSDGVLTPVLRKVRWEP
jgi:hypothetical protein